MANKNIGTLQPGQKVTITGKYKATEADMGKTDVVNTVTARSSGFASTGASKAATMEAVRYAFDATKMQSNQPADGVAYNAGETVTWDIEATNTGNQTLSNLIVSELLTDATLKDGATMQDIAPKASATKQAQYVIKKSDLGREDLQNTVNISNGKAYKTGVKSPLVIVDAGITKTIYVYLTYNSSLSNYTIHFSPEPMPSLGNLSFTLDKDYVIPDKKQPWNSYREQIASVQVHDEIKPKHTDSWFNRCYNLTDISDLSKINTSKLETAKYMFEQCAKVESLKPLQDWDVRNLTDMDSMFLRMETLKTLDGLQDWDVRNLTNANYAFGELYKIPSIDELKGWRPYKLRSLQSLFSGCWNIPNTDGLSEWGISVTDMTGAFLNCQKLNDLTGLSNLDTSELTSLNQAFQGCDNLQYLNGLEAWETESLKQMLHGFSRCNSLANVEPLSGWHTGNVNDMSYSFYNCSKVQTFAPLNNWNVSSVSNHTGCFNGTTGTRPTWGVNW